MRAGCDKTDSQGKPRAIALKALQAADPGLNWHGRDEDICGLQGPESPGISLGLYLIVNCPEGSAEKRAT
jgi:hypothetical protein